jgi:hypothetical protein
MEFEFTERENKSFEFILGNYQRQQGIFCIKDIQKALNTHRTDAVRMIERQKRMGILRDIDSKIARKILGTSEKLGRHHYYKINLESSFAKWWFDNKRAIAIEVLKQEFGEKANSFIKSLKKKIETKSILKQLKNL